MNGKYEIWDKVYIVESARLVRECRIRKFNGNLVVLEFMDSHGAIQVPISRLFPTWEDANEYLQSWNKKKRGIIPRRHI